MATKQFKTGEVIFKQNDFELAMYHILSGNVGIFLDYGKETEKQLVILESGHYFGEMGLIQGLKRSADAVAMSSDTEVEFIDKENFVPYIQAHPETTVELLAQISTRLRDLTSDYHEACHTIAQLSEIETIQKAVEDGEKTESGSWLSRQMKRFAAAYNSGGMDYVHFNL